MQNASLVLLVEVGVVVMLLLLLLLLPLRLQQLQLQKKEAGDEIPNLQAWGEWRLDVENNPGVLIIPVWPWIWAVWSMAVAIVLEVCRTIFAIKNFKITNDRAGLTRSAMFLIVFQVIHAVGNLHVFLGPDDFNGYGYFYVRLYGTGFGLPANIVEEYLLLAALLHVFVAIKRTWDISLNYTVASGQLNLAITGVALLTFMTIHLSQFRFGATEPYLVRPPPFFINFIGVLKLQLFWVDDPTVDPVPVRDIYKLEFEIFKSLGWVFFYMFSVFMFMAHACLGWKKSRPCPSSSHTKGSHRACEGHRICHDHWYWPCLFVIPYVHSLHGNESWSSWNPRLIIACLSRETVLQELVQEMSNQTCDLNRLAINRW
jgi:hypothetical protein